jgi:F0F1-type ATP synthase assembly protein I
MNADQVNTLGGVCELLGLVTVAWGLVDVASYRGDLARLRAWLDARRRTVVATVQKLLRRPGRSVVVHAGAAVASGIAFGAVAKGMRGPFTPRPGQSLEDQIAELGLLVNRLREELLTQDREHRQEIDALRKQTDDKLQAERARADAALNAVREDLAQLRETTTGGLRLEIDGILGVLVGVIFSTWPDAVAGWLPSWPPFRVALTILFLYVGVRVLFAYARYYDARAERS